MLKLLNDIMLVLPDEEEFIHEDKKVNEALKAGRLIMPDSFQGAIKKTPMTGELVTWGDKCRYEHKEGERVVFGRFAWTKFIYEKKKYYLLREQDLLAKYA